MKTSESHRPPRWVVLFVLLGLSGGLMAMPPRVRDPLRGATATALRPGLSATRRAVDGSAQAVAWLRATHGAAEQIARLREEVEALRDRNRQLELATAILRREAETGGAAMVSAAGGDPLLVPRLYRANVLGDEATGVLRKQRILASGSRAGVAPGALVLDAPGVVLDQGTNEGIADGHLVLSQRAVVGRVIQASPWASVMQLVTDEGYRELVQLAHQTGRGLRFGPQGVWQGTGNDLCRVTLVEADRPVAIGDLVYSARADGGVRHPLLYGEVVRTEQQPGAPHWEIWVRPAADLSDLREVLVLRTELNPVRIADQPDRSPRR
ncbi:MAG: rod shape-determining protein MreC [Pirellulales bacterium]